MSQTFDDFITEQDIDGLMRAVEKRTRARISKRKFHGMESDDVVQEVLIKSCKAVEKFNPKLASASTYFDRIIMNTICNCYEKASSIKNRMITESYSYEEDLSRTDVEDYGSVEASPYSVQGEYDYNYLVVETQMLIDSIDFTDVERDIIRLRSAGYEFKEIAEITGYTKARISQLWKSIRNKLEE